MPKNSALQGSCWQNQVNFEIYYDLILNSCISSRLKVSYFCFIGNGLLSEIPSRYAVDRSQQAFW